MPEHAKPLESASQRHAVVGRVGLRDPIVPPLPCARSSRPLGGHRLHRGWPASGTDSPGRIHRRGCRPLRCSLRAPTRNWLLNLSVTGCAREPGLTRLTPEVAFARRPAGQQSEEPLESTAYLLLEDGGRFDGYRVGASNLALGEVVFNTCMTGYQEVLTDPSYTGQLVTMTYPLIGNYGVNSEDRESPVPQVAGFIVREASRLTLQLALRGRPRRLSEAERHHRDRRSRHARAHATHPFEGRDARGDRSGRHGRRGGDGEGAGASAHGGPRPRLWSLDRAAVLGPCHR